MSLNYEYLLKLKLYRRIAGALRELENLLWIYTHEETSTLWVALQGMNNIVPQYRSDLPRFLLKRRVRRNVSRILVTLTDLAFRKLSIAPIADSSYGVNNSHHHNQFDLG
jgi:hypothetical protein